MKYFIYRIFNEDESLGAYIGSTNNVKQRIRSHRHNCKKNPNSLPAYSIINANGGFDKWKTEIVEELESENRQDIFKREKYWIENTENRLNNNTGKCNDLNAYMAKWYEKNRENILQKKKGYYQDNREKRLAYQRAYLEKKKSNNNINDCATNEIPCQD